MLLNLPNFTLLGSDQTDLDICLSVEAKTAPTTCQRCRNLLSKIYAHGTRDQFFNDLPFHGKRVALKVKRRRFKCTTCGATFDEFLSDIHPGHNMTKRLVDHICKAAYRRTFRDIAEDTGVTEKTIRNVFNEHCEEKLKRYEFVTPRVLGIDEIFLPTPRGVITNIETSTIIDMLPVRTKVEMINFLQKLNRNTVEVVCMDMHTPYKEAVNLIFPKAKVVADKFHVMRYGIDIMEKVRKEVRKTLDDKTRKRLKNDRHILLTRNYNLLDDEMDRLLDWEKAFPVLGETYKLKEAFLDIFDCTSDIDAMMKYEAWARSLEGIHQTNFAPIISAFSNWFHEIFNIFRMPYTNAATESMNARIRKAYDQGKGYTFEVIRAKILFQENLHKRVRKPRYDRSAFSKFTFDYLTSYEPPRDEYINYGVDISTLLELIDSGMF